MKKLNKSVLVSALSLVVSGVYADVTDASDCSSMNNVRSFSFWEKPSLVVQCVIGKEASASGAFPEKGQEPMLQIGRNDAGAFEPEVSGEDTQLHVGFSDSAGERVTYTATSVFSEDMSSEIFDFVVEGSGIGTADFSFEGEGDIEDGLKANISLYDSNANRVASVNFPGETPNAADYDNQILGGNLRSRGETGFDLYVENISFDSSSQYEVVRSENQIIEVRSVYYEEDAEVEEAYEGYLAQVWSGEFFSGTFQRNAFESSWDVEGEYSTLAGGVRTPLSDVQALINSEVRASYRGESSFLNQEIELYVDFGAESFSANVGDIRQNPDYINGLGDSDMSFRAEGVLLGRDLISTSVSSDASHNVSGVMQGSFVGDNAIGIVGAYDITKNGSTIKDTYAVGRDGEIHGN